MNVLITGAEGALGSAVVSRFLSGSCQVFATYLQSKPERSHPQLKWVQMDITNLESIKKNIGAEKIDSLVHCAGGFRWARADEVSEGDMDFLMNTNLRSAFLLVKQILPGMKERGFGRLVFVSSKTTLSPVAGMAAYAASKAGLNMLTLSLAEEVKSYDINVNAVLPTIIDTPANRRDMPKADFSSWVTPAELAEVMFSLTQAQGKPIHGALIPVSGRV